jgi:hypothetical protein
MLRKNSHEKACEKRGISIFGFTEIRHVQLLAGMAVFALSGRKDPHISGEP